QISQFREVGMSKHGVVVEGDLGVKRHEFTRLRHDQGIDFSHAAVQLDVETAERPHELLGASYRRPLETEPTTELAYLETVKSDVRIEMLLEYLFRSLLGHLLDFYAPFG